MGLDQAEPASESEISVQEVSTGIPVSADMDKKKWMDRYLLKVKVETVLIIIAMTGLVLTGITIGNRIHHHQMLRDIRIKFEQLHDRIEDQDTDTKSV